MLTFLCILQMGVPFTVLGLRVEQPHSSMEQERLARILTDPGLEGGEVLVYFGDSLDAGRVPLREPDKTYQNVQRHGGQLWDEIRQRGGGVVGNVPAKAHANPPRIGFNVGGDSYYADSDPFDVLPEALVVEVDGEAKLKVAYDQRTGQQVYPGQMMQVFLGESLDTGVFGATRRADHVFMSNRLSPKFWQQAGGHSSIVFVNFPANRRKSGKLEFTVKGETYITQYPVPAERETAMLLLEVKSDGTPSIAYDPLTGNKVFDFDEQVLVYWGATLSDGHLDNAGRPDEILPVGHMITDVTRNQVAQAKGAVFMHYPTSIRRGKVILNFSGHPYVVGDQDDFEGEVRLTLQADQYAQVLVAYDERSGRQVHSSDSQIAFYFGETLTKGLYVPDRPADELVASQRGGFKKIWDRVKQAEGAVVVHWPTKPKKNIAYFRINSKAHSTGLPYDSQRPMVLSIALDALGQVVIARDESSGEIVYSASSDSAPEIELYWGQDFARVHDAAVKPDQVLRSNTAMRGDALWTNIRDNGGAIVRHYSTKQIHGKYGFSVRDVDYKTRLDYSEDRPLYLTLVLGEDSHVLVAYDELTDNVVYLPHMSSLGHVAALARSKQGWLNIAGLEEMFDGWSRQVQGADAFVLTDALLQVEQGVALKSLLRKLPAELAGRVYLVGPGWTGLEEENEQLRFVEESAPEALAVQLLQQVPSPASVWVVGPSKGLSSMLQEFGMQVQVLLNPQSIQAFLLQMGRALGVPEAVIHAGMEALVGLEAIETAA